MLCYVDQNNRRAHLRKIHRPKRILIIHFNFYKQILKSSFKMLARESIPPNSFYPDPNVSLIPPGGRMGHSSVVGGGLYSVADISSPSLFQMSMVDASTPQTSMMPHHHQTSGISKRGGVGSIKDLNNYLPVHKIKVEEGYPRRLFTVENNVTRETIVVLTCSQQIMLFMLKIKENGEDLVGKPASEKFEFVKFHELHIQPHDLEGFTISQDCSITLAPFKLTYALSTRSGKTVYVYDQGDSGEVPESLNLDELSEDGNNSAVNCHIIQFVHDYPVTHLAIDSEKQYLACIQELGTINVWDIHSKAKLAVFTIPHQGVHISFHRSEPYQLMVIDTNGWARFFNVFRQSCFRSIHLIQSNVFSADWSLSNSSIFAAGFAESFTVIDTCKVLSSFNKCYEVPELIINAIKVNPMDDKEFATLSRLTGTIQLWRENFSSNIWKHRNEHVNDIAWVHGYPYLLALGHQTLYFYESSVS